MTRETKIGLLVGLGFIVVFAMLLSHTPETNVAMAPAQKPQATSPVLSGGIRTEIGRPEPIPPTVDTSRVPGSGPEAEPAPVGPEDRVVSLDSLPDLLPAPRLLDPAAPLAVATADEKREAEVTSPVAILSHRTAPALPQVEEPKPNVPHDPPSQSPAPDRSKTELADSRGAKVAPPLNPPKEYVVQSKDNLVKIARKYYRNSDPGVIQFLVRSNEGRIKDADTIVEGQKLLIPDLPPEMFERVPGFDVQLASGRAISMEDLLNDPKRKAPVAANSSDKPDTKSGSRAPSKADLNLGSPPTAKSSPGSEASKGASTVKPDENSAPRLSLSGLVPVRPTAATSSKAVSGKATEPDAKTRKDDKSERRSKDPKADAAEGDQLYRWYEIKANDTLGTIARKELGSSQHWQEIQKLNRGVDPQRMRPGERIKLPLKPVSTSSRRGRASA